MLFLQARMPALNTDFKNICSVCTALLEVLHWAYTAHKIIFIHNLNRILMSCGNSRTAIGSGFQHSFKNLCRQGRAQIMRSYIAIARRNCSWALYVTESCRFPRQQHAESDSGCLLLTVIPPAHQFCFARPPGPVQQRSSAPQSVSASILCLLFSKLTILPHRQKLYFYPQPQRLPNLQPGFNRWFFINAPLFQFCRNHSCLLKSAGPEVTTTAVPPYRFYRAFNNDHCTIFQIKQRPDYFLCHL